MLWDNDDMEAVRHDLKAARKAYERFHLKPYNARQTKRLKSLWPNTWGIVAIAESIGYRSDKWNDKGEWEDYIHPFDGVPPLILRDLVRGDKPYSARKMEIPDQPAFAYLGYALDLQFVDEDDKIQHYDWTEERYLPYLAWYEPKKWLIIHTRRGKDTPLIVTSPSLRITERGIEG